MNQPSPIPEAPTPILTLLFQRFSGRNGKLKRGAQSRIAEHLGITYGTVSQWVSKKKLATLATSHRLLN